MQWSCEEPSPLNLEVEILGVAGHKGFELENCRFTASNSTPELPPPMSGAGINYRWLPWASRSGGRFVVASDFCGRAFLFRKLLFLLVSAPGLEPGTL
jgi:hypothetical protein